MKKQLITSIKIGSIALVLILGATHAFAFRVLPDQTTNAYVPVNVGPDAQTMKASFGVTGFLKAGSSVSIPTGTPTWNESGFVIGETNMVSPKGIMKYMFLPSKTSQLKIGSSAINVQLPAAQPFTADMKTPLIIDMKGRGNSVKNNPTGREAIDMIADGSTNPQTAIRTAAPAIEFNSSVNAGGKADIIAGALQLSESNAGALKVLVATDTDGNAVWGSMSVVTENGVKKIKVNYPGSTVAIGQNLCSAPPVIIDLCTNIVGDQTIIPAGMVKDTTGSTPGVCTTPSADFCPNIAGAQATIPAGMTIDANGDCITPPVVDLCTNIGGTQTAVPVGMVKDTSGSAPGVCTTPAVDACNNIPGLQTAAPTGMIGIGGECHIYCVPSLRPDFNHNTPYYCIYETGSTTGPDVDLCKNIAGSQGLIPSGMVAETNGDCSTPTVDVCPNITGNQTEIPTGRIRSANGNCITSMCSNIDSIRQFLPGEYPSPSASGVPAGYTLHTDGTCKQISYWLYTDGVKLSNGTVTPYTWLSWARFGTNGDKPAMIQYTSSPSFHQPYCTSVNYRPGDKYFNGGAICAEYGVTPDPAAYSTTSTPQMQGCSNYPDLYMSACN